MSATTGNVVETGTVAKMQAKERPIIFSGPMIQAILAGRKTQTRRVVKPQPEHWRCDAPGMEDIGGLAWKGRLCEADAFPGRPPKHSDALEDLCPYGQPGDLLYVKESWRPRSWSAEGGWGEIEYRADGSARQVEGPWSFERMFPFDMPPARWRPSTHMPRWASRITLEITGVRVQRLGEISDEDAIAEGIEPKGVGRDGKPRWIVYGLEHLGQVTTSPAWSYERLWDTIHGDGAWVHDKDKWVWAITFRKVEVQS